MALLIPRAVGGTGVGAGAAVDPTIVDVTLTGTTNDLAGLEDADVARLATAADRILTGIDATGRTAGRPLWLLNVSSSTITLAHETGSAVGNQFSFPADTSVQLAPDAAVAVVRDGTTTKWRQVAGRDQPTADAAALE